MTINEQNLINGILQLIEAESSFDCEVFNIEFLNFSVYKAEIGFITEKLSVEKRTIILKLIHQYLSTIDENAFLVGSKRHPNDFDLEIIIVSLEINLCEVN